MAPHDIWMPEQRAELHLSFTTYDLSNENKVAIFNKVFDDYLRSQKLPKGLDFHKLNVQYCERTRPGRYHQWGPATKEPTNPVEQAVRGGHLRSINATAATLKIPFNLTARQPSSNTPAGLDMCKLNLESRQPVSITRADLTDGPSGKGKSLQSASGAADASDSGKTRAHFGDTASSTAENGEEDETKGTSTRNRTALAAEARRKANIHPEDTTPCKWSVEDFSHHDIIEPDDPVFLHGGPVCRISEASGDKNTPDYMVCDPEYCRECGDNEDTLKQSVSLGGPFVHSSDTMKGAKKATVFRPQKHGSLEVAVQGFVGNVRFETEQGLKAVRAQICGYVGCGVCEGQSARR